jgi:hypothetical protein
MNISFSIRAEVLPSQVLAFHFGVLPTDVEDELIRTQAEIDEELVSLCHTYKPSLIQCPSNASGNRRKRGVLAGIAIALVLAIAAYATYRATVAGGEVDQLRAEVAGLKKALEQHVEEAQRFHRLANLSTAALI